MWDQNKIITLTDAVGGLSRGGSGANRALGGREAVGDADDNDDAVGGRDESSSGMPDKNCLRPILSE